MLMNAVYKIFAKLATDQRGLTAVEYAVLGAFVVVAVAAVGGTFKTSLTSAYTTLFTSVPT